jgi:ribosomal protein L11
MAEDLGTVAYEIDVELHVEGPAAFAGALVDALRRHGVDVVDWGDEALARTLDVDHEVTVPVTVRGSDAAVEAAVAEFVAEYPESVVREASAGLG